MSKTTVIRYAEVIGMTIGVGIIHHSLQPVLGDQTPYTLFILPIIVGAARSGLNAGLFATALGAAAASYIFTKPYFSWDIASAADRLSLLLFIGVGLIISMLGQRFRNMRIHERQMAYELRKADKYKNEFLALLAHELRNPLSGIRAASDVISLADSNNAQLPKMVGVINRQVDYMNHMISDLLDVARVTRGIFKLEKQFVDFHAIVQDALAQTGSLISARNHTLTIHPGSQEVTVFGDRDRLVQVVGNLLSNAAKYTPDGGTITLTIDADATHVQCIIEDNGIGLSADILPSVFEIFVQAKRTPDRRSGGLGLGLAIAKRIVDAHGGAIHVDSDGEGKGSRFTVRLPRTQVGDKSGNEV